MIKCRNIYKETDSDCPYYFMVRLENGILYVEGLSYSKTDYGGERKQLFSKTYNLNRSFIKNTCFHIYKCLDRQGLSNLAIAGKGNKESVFDAYKLSSVEEIIVYLGDNIDEVLVLIPNTPVLDNGNIEIYVKTKTSEAIIEEFPKYKEKYNALEAKRRMLADIDINESMSALEAQIDFLSKLVLAIFNNFPQIRENLLLEGINIKRFEEVVESTNVMSIKSQEETLDEIQKQKNIIRNKQRVYYKEVRR